tara:strand:+ start:3835 stop:5157 length:1323 start_codon:yes stop_codon:yes gene_type:complete
MIPQIIFTLLFLTGTGIFAFKIKKIRRNIFLGKPLEIKDNKAERWKTMAKVAMGQSKMVVRPVAGFFHILIYVGFVLINIEVLEIIIDGLTGEHRFFAPYLGSFYNFLIGFFEILALLVVVACFVFLYRRNISSIRRFKMPEMKGWPKLDGNLILVVEVVLMGALLKMNACDQILQLRGADHYMVAGSFPISQFLVPFFDGFETGTLITFERIFWWAHITGILIFLNYVPYSKHFHIILAFPNTYYSNLKPKGQLNNMAAVKKEVDLMMGGDPFATPETTVDDGPPERFGVKDVTDLNWKNLLDAYSCTECGRCTDNCPANQTGKLLSPRKVMMDTRDRIEEVGKNIDKAGKPVEDGISLLGNYITEEELWACTTCNACVDACPLNIDPLNIIMNMRRYLIMEESKSPDSVTSMFNNVENNGAPWAFPAADRGKWIDELN